MKTLVGVKFKEKGKMEYYDPDGKVFSVGDGVVCEGPLGLQYGEIYMKNTEIDETTLDPEKPILPIIRFASYKDREKVKQNKEKAISAFFANPTGN